MFLDRFRRRRDSQPPEFETTFLCWEELSQCVKINPFLLLIADWNYAARHRGLVVDCIDYIVLPDYQVDYTRPASIGKVGEKGDLATDNF